MKNIFIAFPTPLAKLFYFKGIIQGGFSVQELVTLMGICN